MKVMIFSFAIIFIVWLSFAIIYRNQPRTSFLDRNHSNLLRGYAICGIFLTHIGQYAGADGIELLGATGVSLFILLSGYGLQESFKKNGRKGFWQKKLLKIYIPYILIETIWLIISKADRSLLDIVLDFSLIEPLHPFGWYLRYLMVCYILFYFTLFIKNVKLRLAVIGGAFAVWFIIRSAFFIDGVAFI